MGLPDVSDYNCKFLTPEITAYVKYIIVLLEKEHGFHIFSVKWIRYKRPEPEAGCEKHGRQSSHLRWMTVETKKSVWLVVQLVWRQGEYWWLTKSIRRSYLKCFEMP